MQNKYNVYAYFPLRDQSALSWPFSFHIWILLQACQGGAFCLESYISRKAVFASLSQNFCSSFLLVIQISFSSCTFGESMHNIESTSLT